MGLAPLGRTAGPRGASAAQQKARPGSSAGMAPGRGPRRLHVPGRAASGRPCGWRAGGRGGRRAHAPCAPCHIGRRRRAAAGPGGAGTTRAGRAGGRRRFPPRGRSGRACFGGAPARRFFSTREVRRGRGAGRRRCQARLPQAGAAVGAPGAAAAARSRSRCGGDGRTCAWRARVSRLLRDSLPGSSAPANFAPRSAALGPPPPSSAVAEGLGPGTPQACGSPAPLTKWRAEGALNRAGPHPSRPPRGSERSRHTCSGSAAPPLPQPRALRRGQLAAPFEGPRTKGRCSPRCRSRRTAPGPAPLARV